jgi:hypothetical protein
MQETGKIIFVLGLVIALAGAWIWSGRGLGWLGRLPGDVSVQNGNFGFYFPLTTCVVVSVVFTLVAWLLRR